MAGLGQPLGLLAGLYLFLAAALLLAPEYLPMPAQNAPAARRLQQWGGHGGGGGGAHANQRAPAEDDYQQAPAAPFFADEDPVGGDDAGPSAAPTFIGWDSPATSLFCGEFCHYASPKEWEDDGNDQDGQLNSVLNGSANTQMMASVGGGHAAAALLLAGAALAGLTLWTMKRAPVREATDPRETQGLLAEEEAGRVWSAAHSGGTLYGAASPLVEEGLY